MNTSSNPSNSEVGAQPYPPSFVDWLMAWIEHLPGPSWGFYLLVTAILVALGHGLRWLDGSLSPWTFDPTKFANDSLTMYPLALMHYLNRIARESFKAFRPALGKLEGGDERLEYELTNMPQSLFTVVIAIGALFSILSIIVDADAWGINEKSSLLTDVITVVQASFSIVFFFVFFVRVMRELRLITRIHREAPRINLYESNTHHAFSRLTARTSIGLVLPIYYYTAIVYMFLDGQSRMSWVDISMISFMVLVSIAVFILPLSDMRRRLVLEKKHLIVESDRRFEAVTRQLHQRVDADNLEKMDDLNKTLASLMIEKDTLKKISTWPWEVETMRGFLSSVGIPILLWLITSYLSRFIG